MARRANNEGNIRQRPDGRWEARATGGIDFHTGEKKRISVYGQSQGEVLAKLHALEHNIHCKDITDPTSTTLLEWLNRRLRRFAGRPGDCPENVPAV